jgi:hypothetical protein
MFKWTGKVTPAKAWFALLAVAALVVSVLAQAKWGP